MTIFLRQFLLLVLPKQAHYTPRRAPVVYPSSLWTLSAHKSRFSSHSQFCAAYIPAGVLIRLWRCLSCACETF
ncbi:hypothetical protein H4582DRAFT_1998387, partial [Lactarius indigo]